jgi:RNA polymerase sigma-70 factor, ECF subfamily
MTGPALRSRVAPARGHSEDPRSQRLKSDSENVAGDSSDNTPAGSTTSAELDAADAERARLGDRVAMETLVLRHQEAVARLLWRFVRTQADLDDLVQETFLRMVRGLPAWKAQQPFSHWLLRIATNAGRDYFRRQAVRRRWVVEPAASQSGEPAIEAVERGADPAARAAANEVKALLEQLAPDDRALLTLHYLEGWGLAQIAGQFGWTVTATKLRAWRARRQLRALLQSDTSS